MNKDMTLDPVSISGYTASDLSGYYSGTYLLYKNEEGEYQPCYVRGIERDDDEPMFYIRVGWGDNMQDRRIVGDEIETSLYRMVIPTGWYLMPRRKPFRYEYKVHRSYKKGLSPDFISIRDTDDRGIEMNNKVLEAMVFPKDKVGDDKWLISRRLVVYNNIIYTTYRGLSVGRVENGAVDTPFRCIQQRVEELNENAS